MKALLSSRGLFILGFALLLATNTVVLSGIAYNRSGEPETLIELTERELRLPYRTHEENSGLSLRLEWRASGNNKNNIYVYSRQTPAWLNEKKLKELEFSDVETNKSVTTKKWYKDHISKDIFIVLEYNGEDYRKAVIMAEDDLKAASDKLQLDNNDKRFINKYNFAKERVEREKNSASRLFAIDAGLDAVKLRKEYSERNRFIIASGSVRINHIYRTKQKEIRGYLKLNSESINVPLKNRDIFNSIIPTPGKSQRYDLGVPRYKIELAYGKRFEPWIRSVRHLEN